MKTKINAHSITSYIENIDQAIREAFEVIGVPCIASFDLGEKKQEFSDEVLEDVLNRFINGEFDHVEYLDARHWSYIIYSWDIIRKISSAKSLTKIANGRYNGTATEIANCTLII